MITKYLPTFKVFEVGSLTGLRSGHMLAQQPAANDIAVVEKNGHKFIENGIIVGLNIDGEVENWTTGAMFVHYTEELNTMVDELKYFAVPVEQKYDNGELVDDFAATYPRCIALYAGDSFCTNNYTYASEVTANNAKYAKVVNGVLQLQSASSGAQFKATKSTLPTGEEAFDFVYVGA